MTPQEAAAKVREWAKTVQAEIKITDPSVYKSRYRFLVGQEFGLRSAVAVIDQITQPQPWPPPENLKCVLGFDIHSQTWMKVTLDPFYAVGYSHWLPMPPKPEVKG